MKKLFTLIIVAACGMNIQAQCPNDNDLMLDLSDAPAGTYFLKFVDQYGSTLNQSRISIK